MSSANKGTACLVFTSMVDLLSCFQELIKQYEAQLAAAKDAASSAAESSDRVNADAVAARTAAAAATEREAVLKQNLHDAEERCVATSSQLGASQRQVSFSKLLACIGCLSIIWVAYGMLLCISENQGAVLPSCAAKNTDFCMA